MIKTGWFIVTHNRRNPKTLPNRSTIIANMLRPLIIITLNLYGVRVCGIYGCASISFSLKAARGGAKPSSFLEAGGVRSVCYHVHCECGRGESMAKFIYTYYTLYISWKQSKLLSLREFRRPCFWRPGASDLCGFVQQPSFDNFYQNRPTMHHNRPKMGPIWPQGGGRIP